MSDYYQKHLSANRLKQVYELASPRVRQYLDAEIAFALTFIKPEHTVLELGSGYGRIVKDVCPNTYEVWGIDNALENLLLAQDELQKFNNYYGAVMDAGRTGFANLSFDTVLCLQNGISAFKVEPTLLLNEAVRLVKPGGVALFSTYASDFWPSRLEWFERQAEAGLLGPIDYDKTGNDVVVCKDGFSSSSVFLDIDQIVLSDSSIEMRLIDESALFYVVRKEKCESKTNNQF